LKLPAHTHTARDARQWQRSCPMLNQVQVLPRARCSQKKRPLTKSARAGNHLGPCGRENIPYSYRHRQCERAYVECAITHTVCDKAVCPFRFRVTVYMLASRYTCEAEQLANRITITHGTDNLRPYNKPVTTIDHLRAGVEVAPPPALIEAVVTSLARRRSQFTVY